MILEVFSSLGDYDSKKESSSMLSSLSEHPREMSCLSSKAQHPDLLPFLIGVGTRFLCHQYSSGAPLPHLRLLVLIPFLADII